MIELWLTVQLKFIPTIKTIKPTYIKHEPGMRTSDVRTLKCAYIRCTHTSVIYRATSHL